MTTNESNELQQETEWTPGHKPVVSHTADGTEYTIRRFQSGDRKKFLDLHDSIDSLRFGGTEEWFRWKFEEPPYLVHVPVFVAEHAGRIVGARPFVPFRLRIGPRTMIGVQTADTMVHPDHRSRGLFSRMNNLAFDYYRQGEPEVMFSVPNSRSRPAYLDIGAKVVGPITTSFRIEHPSQFTADKLGPWVPDGIGPLLDGAASGFFSMKDWQREIDGVQDVTVERRTTVPADTMASLYQRAVPDGFHVLREPEFYEWRFSNPEWEYDVFLARRGETPVGGLIAATKQFRGRTVTRITEVLPLSDPDTGAIAALLDRLLEVATETDVFTVANDAIPSDILDLFGFEPDNRLPLKPLANQTVLISMPLRGNTTGDNWTIERRDLADPKNWQLPFCEQNTS